MGSTGRHRGGRRRALVITVGEGLFFLKGPSLIRIHHMAWLVCRRERISRHQATARVLVVSDRKAIVPRPEDNTYGVGQKLSPEYRLFIQRLSIMLAPSFVTGTSLKKSKSVPTYRDAFGCVPYIMNVDEHRYLW